ncbi:uncharacterized protein BT62DRAFT_938856 [Guyanagaster necrorhizus]|uniref:Uncharacterized protein n=1 Tax=Guyanagaster necrorhizus TaxID=856835 RepID=A0A9P7VFD7_9AGAR|nr:uncharacterized protein BT62DRAFT_938856 [Guyanagaster necrorhizus MCA 3950]KAG7439553.1 hypothetical protein BT62DRAFT_938856 [Guyanagaster necrorhizus MCA 3950]
MPAPDASLTVRPALGHVNLMVDTFIANAQVDDLRSIIRNLVGSGIPNIGSTFSEAARNRLQRSGATTDPVQGPLFNRDAHDGSIYPSEYLQEALRRARCLFGAGLGFTSLVILAVVVRATIGLRWNNESEVANILVNVDADICQAIQSSKEELEGGRVDDYAMACEAARELRNAVKESLLDVESWGGEYPFERASSSFEYWKV